MKVMLLAMACMQTEAAKPPTKEAVLAMHELNEELEKAGSCSISAASRRPAAASVTSQVSVRAYPRVGSCRSRRRGQRGLFDALVEASPESE